MEISEYSEIFFLSKIEKILNPVLSEQEGEYKVVIGDDIQYRYEVLEILGKGTFGQVLKVFDHCEKKFAAMKIIKNNQRFFDKSLIEVEILSYLHSKKSEYKKTIVLYNGNFVFRGHMVKNI